MTVLVVLMAGEIAPTAQLRAFVQGKTVIAADAGIRHAKALDVKPTLWVGDFDSTSAELLAAFDHVEKRSLPREKDITDGEYAIVEALALGGTELLIVGALGGARTDHVFSNLVLASSYADRVQRLVCFDGREWVYPLRHDQVLSHEARAGVQFSVCKFSAIGNLSIRGARWPLYNVDVPFLSILTQSNEALGPVEIELSSGRALAIFEAN
ncbi:thiamine diphosphokinase [Aureimonas fodinaquatilis]|uniref:Thiamine diphosphokinase n=1 Tax=Aureimonas fodinaquatilis TaxID=2565783 RepID=A0A5B0DTF1_9HYPH|nr:thiamine diphosphokinase [Aureimonas fodinaquatilis]KAA0968880.1 thiamine diphosphokinase [Aureimonas fodinaquatilis]